MLVADTVLQKRYKVIRAVGHGGMGAVYLAKDLRLGSVVALKENFFSDEKMIKAFEHEARLLASLRHVALPKVFDHFSIGEGQFLVMEYIHGDDFVEMLEKREKLIEPAGQPKPFEVHEVLPWAEQLLDALDYIHTQQYPIIHRDIKPQNLKLARRNQIILLDFGLAKGNSSQTSIKSTSGSVIGYTPNYAPIEQIQGVGTDPRTDLYSLGATFYHLLTGLPPIASTIRAEAFLGGEADPLRPPRMFNAKIPPGLSDLIMTALQQHRNNRPPSAAEMLKMLRAVTHPIVGVLDAKKQVGKYKTTVLDLKQAAEIAQEQQEKARQEEIESQRQKQLEEQARRSREEANARRQKLEDQLRQAHKEAEQLREQEARAYKARQEAEDFRRELEEQTREAIAELERQVLLEEQARKSGEAIEQLKRQEDLLQRAAMAQAQERAREEQAQRQRQEAAARQQYLEEQARKAREEEQQKLQAAELARQAQEEAERLRHQLQEQARKAQEEARKAEEEAQRRKLQEEEARKAREEAQRLKLLEQQRQAQEEAERKKLQEELERRMKGEAQMQKALQDWEQMAREDAERKRLLEEQMEQAREEAQRLKQLLEEQTLKASQEAQKRQALEAQAQKAALEAEKRKLLEEEARQATAEADHLRQKEEERRVREDWEKKKLEEERVQIAREDNQRLQQLENLAQAAAQESEKFKRQLEEQSRRAELEAEKRRELEEEVREAERRLLEEQERNAEIERTERVTQVMSHTRELVAWDGIQEGKASRQAKQVGFSVPGNESSMPPLLTERELFIQSLEEKPPEQTKWIVAGAVFIALAILVIVRIALSTSPTNQNVETNPALTSLISADRYVQIQPGNFIMGSENGLKDEKPAHKVVLTRGFEMGKYEVTQEQWEAVMGSNPSKFSGANLPVDNISWSDIKGFIDKLSKKDAAHFYRLPTEAEWEYACRAGSASETFANLDAVAWYKKNSENLTHPVGQKQPNAWGLYDMIGNVFEYCQDFYLENYYSHYKDENSINPPGPPDGTLYCFRGGNYASPVENCRLATRWGAKPVEKVDRVGFRLVRLPR